MKKRSSSFESGQGIYCSTYCNFGHYIESGKPVEHECRTIPPAALAAEMDGDYDLAIRLMKDDDWYRRWE